jgi:hypothetical protein
MSEMAPLFCTTDVPFEVIGEHMQDHFNNNNISTKPRRLLVGGMKVEKMLIATPLLRWYLEKGLIITKIHLVLEYNRAKCFSGFNQTVSDARRLGDIDQKYEILGDTSKLIGNASYGGLLVNKSKHTDVEFIRGKQQVKLLANQPRYKDMTLLDEDLFEVQMAKKVINQDIPIILGFFVLAYAKLRMLSFYYDSLCKYVDKEKFQCIQMDTDSLYFGLAAKSLAEAIKPEMREEYDKYILGSCNDLPYESDENRWFPRECCQEHVKYDKRTSGLFKIEAEGDLMIALCSKTYFLRLSEEQGYKMSSKGISKKFVTDPQTIFENVLQSQKAAAGTNRGFRVKDMTMYTYEQTRNGFSYAYMKRKLHADGIHTSPLDMIMTPWVTHNRYLFDEKSDAILGYDNTDFPFWSEKYQKTFTSIHQAMLYASYTVMRNATKLREIETTTSNDQLNNIPFPCSTEWYDIETNTLESFMMEKTQAHLLLRSHLININKETIDYCSTLHKQLSCGFDLRNADVVHPRNYSGRNTYGRTWEKIRKLLLSNN